MPMTSSPTSFGTQPWTLPGAPPLHATARDPSRFSEGEQIAVVARTLGTPLLPWQKYVADVATERRPDGSYEYEIVVVSVPRQTGKTTLIRAMGVHRALSGRDVFYTAQTGKDARARWFDLVKLLRVNAAFRDRIKVALRGGSEHVAFWGGSVFQCFAPTPESLHGYTPPTVVIDEAFAQTGGSGELLMGAIDPAQFTIVDKQIWIVSTMGTAESTFLHDWIDKGIEGTPRVACFVWGARDDQNPYDLDDIAAFHPGVGFQLGGKVIAPEDVLKAVEKNTRAEYERAYGNRRTVTASHLVPADSWNALTIDGLQPPATTSDLVLTFDVSAGRDQSTINATWLDGDRPRVKVVQAGPGTGWLAAAVDQLRRDWTPRATAAVGNGPVLDVIDQVNRLAGFDAVTVLTEREYATACSAFLTAIEEATLGHDGDELLTASVVGLVTRAAVADGVAFSRRNSVGNSAPAVAAAAGCWIATSQPKPSKPVIYFGKDVA